METDLILYANFYHNHGMALNFMSFNDDLRWEIEPNKQFVEFNPQISEKEYSQVKILLGYNQYRAIEIFNFKIEEIEICLKIMKLPEDYPWIIKCEHNCCIIIKAKGKDIPLDMANVYFNHKSSVDSYRANAKLLWNNWLYHHAKDGIYGNNWGECLTYNPFEEESSWYSLPPSISKDGIYEFYHKKLPSYSPLEVSVDCINNFFDYHCGEDEYIKYYHNDKEIYLIKRTLGVINLYDNNWQMKMNIEKWLLNCSSSNALNSRGVDCVLKEYVTEDTKTQAKLYFEQANNPHAHFNLANLIACGYIDGDMENVNYHLSFCGAFSDKYKEIIKINATKNYDSTSI